MIQKNDTQSVRQVAGWSTICIHRSFLRFLFSRMIQNDTEWYRRMIHSQCVSTCIHKHTSGSIHIFLQRDYKKDPCIHIVDQPAIEVWYTASVFLCLYRKKRSGAYIYTCKETYQKDLCIDIVDQPVTEVWYTVSVSLCLHRKKRVGLYMCIYALYMCIYAKKGLYMCIYAKKRYDTQSVYLFDKISVKESICAYTGNRPIST